MLTFVLLISLLTCSPDQEVKSAQPSKESVAQDAAPYNCSQTSAEQEPLIREAVENHYLIRRVIFSGNAHTRDRVLRRNITFQEGDVFTGENLVKGLENVSKLKKIIYPVKLSDVIISLDRPEKTIDMIICFKERRK